MNQNSKYPLNIKLALISAAVMVGGAVTACSSKKDSNQPPTDISTSSSSSPESEQNIETETNSNNEEAITIEPIAVNTDESLNNIDQPIAKTEEPICVYDDFENCTLAMASKFTISISTLRLTDTGNLTVKTGSIEPRIRWRPRDGKYVSELEKLDIASNNLKIARENAKQSKDKLALAKETLQAASEQFARTKKLLETHRSVCEVNLPGAAKEIFRDDKGNRNKAKEEELKAKVGDFKCQHEDCPTYMRVKTCFELDLAELTLMAQASDSKAAALLIQSLSNLELSKTKYEEHKLALESAERDLDLAEKGINPNAETEIRELGRLVGVARDELLMAPYKLESLSSGGFWDMTDSRTYHTEFHNNAAHVLIPSYQIESGKMNFDLVVVQSDTLGEDLLVEYPFPIDLSDADMRVLKNGGSISKPYIGLEKDGEGISVEFKIQGLIEGGDPEKKSTEQPVSISTIGLDPSKAKKKFGITF